MGVADSADVFDLIGQRLQVFFSTSAVIYILKYLTSPWESVSAGRAKAAAFMAKEAGKMTSDVHY